MNKELEALERVDDYVDKDYDYCQKGDYSKDYKLIKQALQRLEAIDNANPSEALECLENLKKQAIAFEHSELAIKVANGNADTIKQVLVKAQEQEKILKILKEKKVELMSLYLSSSVEQYNNQFVRDENKLTQNEFDLLKRYLK